MQSNTEDLKQWSEIVVEINKQNWLDVLIEVYTKAQDSESSHFRFSSYRGRYGISLRLFNPKDAVVQDIISTLKIRGLVVAVNPKWSGENDTLSELSGWYDSSEDIGPSREWTDLLQKMSDLAIKSFKNGFTSSLKRDKVVHQFCNMMALVEQKRPSISRFNI